MIAFFLFLFFSNEFLFNRVCNAWQPKPIELKPGMYKTGILLGGLSSVDRYSGELFSSAADRFIQANKLYHQGIINKIVVSGGRINRHEPKEADFIRSQLIASGTSQSDIVVENRSRNTYENAIFTKKIIDSQRVDGPFLLITSALHMRRALSVFKKTSIQVTGYPCNYTVINKKFDFKDYIWPDIGVLDQWKFLLKEIAGLGLYKLSGKA